MLLLLAACRRDGLTAEQRSVRCAAEKCYSLLADQRYEKFVEEISYADQMSPEYRSQMVDLVHEHVATEHSRHGRMLSAKAVGDTIDGDMAQVFLQLVFADHTTEEVGLPMVKVDDEWKMQ